MSTSVKSGYRRFLTEHGESPILPDDLGLMLRRRWEFQAASGLDEAHTHTDPMLAFPLPVYERDRWSGNASMMWCPLAWLPAPLYGPTGGVPSCPTPAVRVWAANTVLALGMSGMYSPDHGFLDVGAEYGFDVEDLDTLRRLQMWQAGGTDPLFDRVAEDMRHRLLSELNPAAAGSLLSMLPLQQQVLADALAASLHASRDAKGVLVGYLTVALDLFGDHQAIAPYLVGDLLLGMIAEVVTPPGAPADTELADELIAEALTDFTTLLDELATGVPVGGV